MTHAPSIDEFLPLTPAVLSILLALADGEKHGYGIMKDVETITGGTVSMGPGTLYGSVKRMTESGLIEELEERADDEHSGKRRRYYALTGLGRKVLEAEVNRLNALVHTANLRLNPGRSE